MRINTNWAGNLLKTKGKKFVLSVAGVTALVGGLATVGVMAAIPDGSGVIHGCYLNTLGTTRIIDSATASCNLTETAITWNHTGPQGVQGIQGPTGPAAASGLKYASAPAEVTLTSAESILGGNSVDLDGPSVTLTVPSGTGSLVDLFGSVESKGNCEVFPTAFIIDETTGDNFSDGNGEGFVQMVSEGPTADYKLRLLGARAAAGSTGYRYTVPAAAGTHTYSFRYKTVAFGEDTTCAASFKNAKLWAQVVTPS